MKNSNGITLISVIGTVVIIMFLIGIAVTTSMKSFDKMRLENFKSELEEIQRRVDEISADYSVATKTNADLNYTTYFKERYSETSPRFLIEFENDPEVSVVITKYELKNRYTGEWKNKESTFYFDESDIKKYLGLKGLDDPVIIDFTERVVYSVRGCKDPDDKKVTYYTLEECTGEKKAYVEDENASTSTTAEVLATYTRKEVGNIDIFPVTLTLNRKNGVEGKSYNIKKAYYSKTGEDWLEVDNLGECNYSRNSVSFIVYEEGSYLFKVEDTSGKMINTTPSVVDLNHSLKTKAEAGEVVKTPEKWAIKTVRNISTTTGNEAESENTVSTVKAVSDGDGNIIPVPEGFFYVGGTLNTGVIISDSEQDKYEGTDVDKTTWEYTTSLKGNQFVWIPCTKEEYVKKSWGQQNANWDTTTPNSEIAQIEKYEGFYVARYEAGLATTIPEHTTTQVNTTAIYNKDGVPQSKAGIIPWISIDWTNSKKNAEAMYNNEYVDSGLITGTQWDVILNKLVEKTDLELTDLTSPSKWGNYRNTQISYKGRMAKATYSSSVWNLPVFSAISEGTTGNYATANTNAELLTTGASSETQKYHIFDIAGNVWEWTEELAIPATTGQYRVIRGGNFVNSYSEHTATYRLSNSITNFGVGTGFRTVLYIK